MSRNLFKRWSGAEVSSQCGVLTGQALVFSQQGERMLVTTDLDLSHGRCVCCVNINTVVSFGYQCSIYIKKRYSLLNIVGFCLTVWCSFISALGV